MTRLRDKLDDPHISDRYLLGKSSNLPLMKVATSDMKDIKWISEYIGNTPLIDVTPSGSASRVFAKAEYFNLTGSIKDRAAFSMINGGLRSGDLRPGVRIIEATSGNTGIGLAVIGRLLGYETTLVMPPQVSRDRKDILESARAEIIWSDRDGGSNGALRRAIEIYEQNPNAWFWPNQYYNPLNYQAHEATAREIFKQTKAMVTHIVCATGTAGTAVGLALAFKKLKPGVHVISVEPSEELHGIEGTKHMATEAVPDILVNGRKLTGIFLSHRQNLARTVFVSTDEAYGGVNLLAASGLYTGISSGANYFAACLVASEQENAVVVTVLPDSSDRYLSEQIYDPAYFAVRISPSVAKNFRSHFADNYPHEGCGLLFGEMTTGGLRHIRAFDPLNNVNSVRAEDRYEIDPQAMLTAEKKYRQSGLKLLGIAHSHPDHPPRPSVFDLDRAWEDLSYVICSVIGGTVVSTKSWALKDADGTREFQEELIHLG